MKSTHTTQLSGPASRFGSNAAKPLAAVIGVMAGATVVTVVAAMFDSASSMPWLTSTPAHEAALAPCARLQGTAARQHCVQTVVAAVQARASEVTVAGRGNAVEGKRLQ